MVVVCYLSLISYCFFSDSIFLLVQCFNPPFSFSSFFLSFSCRTVAFGCFSYRRSDAENQKQRSHANTERINAHINRLLPTRRAVIVHVNECTEHADNDDYSRRRPMTNNGQDMPRYQLHTSTQRKHRKLSIDQISRQQRHAYLELIADRIRAGVSALAAAHSSVLSLFNPRWLLPFESREDPHELHDRLKYLSKHVTVDVIDE